MDTYAEIRSIISAFIQEAYPEARGLGLDAGSGHGEFTAPLGYLPGLDAGECAAALKGLAACSPPAYLGEELIGGIYPMGAHLCFTLTDRAYSAMVRRTLERYPPPSLPEDTSNPVDYAIARMLMLSRQGGEGCPSDARVKEALWLAYGIEGFSGKKREAMRLRAAAALTGMLDGRSPWEREALRRELGRVGGCGARLLALPPAGRAHARGGGS